MTQLHRSEVPWEYHDVTVSSEVFPDGVGFEEWTVACGACGSWFLDRRILGKRKTLEGARRLALRHRQGLDAHAKYLKAHPLKGDYPIRPGRGRPSSPKAARSSSRSPGRR